MLLDDQSNLLVEQRAVPSANLKRYVIADTYLPKNIADPSMLSLLLINDGQDLEDMPFAPSLNALLQTAETGPVLCVGLHCNKYRRDEYGTANELDFAGRGTQSKAYQQFITEELLPFLYKEYGVASFRSKAIAGFSLGGLSALDTAWNHPGMFNTVGVFSGSLWWRSRDLGEGYDDHQHRIMQQQIRKGRFQAGMRFYFTTGSLDEKADRNGNGIIDSIDDTQDTIAELVKLGYKQDEDICYVNDEQGRHDVATWGKAMPAFLKWAFGNDAHDINEKKEKHDAVNEHLSDMAR